MVPGCHAIILDKERRSVNGKKLHSENPGPPVVEGASIIAEVIDSGKGKKKIIYHHKRRKGYRVKKGYRESYTDLRVTDILACNT